jgi:ABC-type multidrug transport system ATPase subunit
MTRLLSLEQVHKAYWRGPHQTVVLADLSLHVNVGELVVIWGQRGAGKTTLARLAAGLEQPDSGVVRFLGETLGRKRGGSKPLLHEGIGWVRRGAAGEELQAVIDHVALPLLSKLSPRRARRAAASVLERVGAGECAELAWASLSDGQRTLVSIAHALVRDPHLLVADDPTAYLNALQREEVMRLLRQTCDEQGIGILVTVPDMPEMAHADQFGSLSEGQLVMPREREKNVIDFPGQKRSA